MSDRGSGVSPRPRLHVALKGVNRVFNSTNESTGREAIAHKNRSRHKRNASIGCGKLGTGRKGEGEYARPGGAAVCNLFRMQRIEEEDVGLLWDNDI